MDLILFVIGAWMILITVVSSIFHPIEENEEWVENLFIIMVLVGTFLVGFGLRGIL